MEALRNEIVIEGTGIFIPEDNIAKGNDAFTILEYAETRSLLLNDLFQVYYPCFFVKLIYYYH